MDKPILNVEGLSYVYGNKLALNKVYFSVNKGECCILLGPNGAGKSTLFALMTRLLDSRDGRIEINGWDLKKQSAQALMGLGVVFQQSTLDLDLTVLQNLHYHASLFGIGYQQASISIQRELERQDMYDRRFEKVRELNGGHKRRLEMARALLNKPSLLLLDEPTVGLDVPSRKAMVEYVHDLCERDHLSVVWATHLIDEVRPSDKLVVLHQGEVKAEGSVESICEKQSTMNISEAFEQIIQKQS